MKTSLLLPCKMWYRTGGSSRRGSGACFSPSAQVKHPLRRRKGRSFVRAKASSVTTYVSLHPETAPSFSSTVQILNVLRSPNSTFTTAISIDINPAFATWQAVVRR
jgi:hypothetical protein